jgi:hypothetical protein
LRERKSKYSIILVLFITIWTATTGYAQTPSPSVDILPLLSQMNAVPGALSMPVLADLNMEVPAEPNAWVVRIVSGGGFTGQYQGLVVASQGTVRCTADFPCRGTLSAPELESISTLLSESVLSKWPQSTAPSSGPVSVCSDCIRVWIELRHREKDGTEKLYSATWDSVTKSSLPVEVKQIYEMAISFRR